jgi:hypothetical protein
MPRVYTFEVGQRVRLGKYGHERNIMPKSRRDSIGTVTKVDRFNSPTVLWDYRKTASGYYAGFIEPVRKVRP